ncbi:MAG: plasmid stabilization system [Ignavibacteria bacterium]|nr:MAG: plasmid stabilization system [Ignavibacteria bacterium]KAF0160335.1 MAG: plasmid stabilization system [Ignavibacteria bacterium]
MPFVVLIPKRVEKQITTLPTDVVERVLLILGSLANNPFPQNSKKLKNRNGYRLRIGEYRIIYEINENEKSIIILRVAHRKDVYKK